MRRDYQRMVSARSQVMAEMGWPSHALNEAKCRKKLSSEMGWAVLIDLDDEVWVPMADMEVHSGLWFFCYEMFCSKGVGGGR